MQNVHGPVIGGYDSVKPAGIVEIADCHPPCDPGLLEYAARVRRSIYKTMSGIAQEQHGFAIAQIRIGQLDGIEVMPLGDEKVLPAIIIVVEKSETPSRVRQSDRPDSLGLAGVGE